jgi:hypothetical protein
MDNVNKTYYILGYKGGDFTEEFFQTPFQFNTLKQAQKTLDSFLAFKNNYEILEVSLCIKRVG